MVRRKTLHPKRKCVNGGVVSATQDMISNLPEAMLTEILLHLRTKEVVRTSILSHRWRRVLCLISEMDLNSNEFPDFKSFKNFMNRFLDIYRERKSCLEKLKLVISSARVNGFSVMGWIEFLAMRELKHLDVECLHVKRGCLKVIPFSLYVCETLLYLRLHRVSLAGSIDKISLPRVKSMCLESNVYANEARLESLISSCPVLEDLSIVRRLGDNIEFLLVHSQSLTTLSVGHEYDIGNVARNVSGRTTELLIDAPRLEYLNFSYEKSKRKIIRNVGSLAKVKFDGLFGVGHPLEGPLGSSLIGIRYVSNGADLLKTEMDRNFLTGISSVREMIISKLAMEFFYAYMDVEPLPQFCNLSSLEAAILSLDLNFLPKLLDCCPNLESIVLDLTIPLNLIPSIRLSSVPQCLSCSLKFVELKNEFMGRPIEMRVVTYFLQNSARLKKLVVHFDGSMQEESLVVLRNLRALPRLSSRCVIVSASGADC